MLYYKFKTFLNNICNMDKELNYHVYWEKQGADSLCGVHCINSLLQGPFFDEIKLSQIALQLDKKQQDLMAEQGITHDYLKYMKQQSGNVALSGNYSIQVLQEALKSLGLQMCSIQTINEKSQLNQKKAFICNSSAHWIAIRNIRGVWYNLNSLGMRLPQIISDFYLSAFLAAIKQSGYQIFSVEGKFPQSNEDTFEFMNDHQQWYPAKRIHKYHMKKSKRKGYKPNISGGDSSQMDKAIALSLGRKYEKYESSGEDSDWENDKPKPPKPFTGQAVSMSGKEGFSIGYQKFEYDPQDIEIVSIMKMTLEEKFSQEPTSGIMVTYRYPDGKKERRFFSKEDKIQTLYDFIWMNRDPKMRFYLVDVMKKQKLTELDFPLQLILEPEDDSLVVSIVDL